MKSERDRLAAAYTATDYEVMLPHGEHFVLRVGEHSSAADLLLLNNNEKYCAFLTPENPGSIALCDEENYARCVAFERSLVHQNRVFLRGVARAQNGGWLDENSYLIIGIDEKSAHRLGAAYGQNAIIMYDLCGCARLVWCDQASEKALEE